MRALSEKAVLKGTGFAVGLLTATVLLTGCGSGLQTVASAGVPASALVVSAAPKLGYAWNAQDKTLRPIIGVPGAAQFGESATAAGTYDMAEADPTGSVAVLLGEAQSIYAMALPGGSPVLLAAKAAPASKIVFSPRGTWAFIFLPGSAEGKLLTQVSTTPQIKSVAFSAPISSAVVSDTGSVATASDSASTSELRVTAISGTVLPLAPLKSLGGMAFIAGTDDLLVADASSNSLIRVRSASTSPVSSSVPTEGFLKTPVSLATSRTARWAVIANGGDASVVRVDLNGTVPAQRSVCNCKPSVVSQLSGEGAFRVTALEQGPVWISDASKSAFPILFIPALPRQVK